MLNVTPDSFSDGGLYRAPEVAIARGLALVAAGADLLDVGGESTRPGQAEAVSAAEECARVIPVIEALAAQVPVPIAIDTTKAAVAAAAVAAGAQVVNDISGGLFDPDMIPTCAGAGAVYVCGHVRGGDLAAVHAAEAAPPTFAEVVAELGTRLASLPPALAGRTIVDPGIGFGKRTAQNLELLRRAGELGRELSCSVMVGPSRKRFLGELTGLPVTERDDATIGATLAAVHAGAHIVRVHDVGRCAAALRVYLAVQGGAS